MTGYFYSLNSVLPNVLVLAKLIFQSKDGLLIEEENLARSKKMVHIFVDQVNLNSESFNNWMHTIFSKPKSKVKVLSYSWILDCDKENQIIDQTGYLLHEHYCT